MSIISEHVTLCLVGLTIITGKSNIRYITSFSTQETAKDAPINHSKLNRLQLDLLQILNQPVKIFLCFLQEDICECTAQCIYSTASSHQFFEQNQK